MNTNILYKLGIFEFNFTTIISFLIGVIIGFILLLLIYALLVVSSMRSKDFIVKSENDDLTVSDVKDMVITAHNHYKDKNKRGKNSRINHCVNLSKTLAIDISSKFYPESKNPLLELSVNELTMLMTYITERVDELLNRRAIRILRKMKLITIVDITNKTKEIEQSEAFKNAVKVGKFASKVRNIISIINPVNLTRRLIVNNIFNLIIDKICIVIISIVGEETYKIYSKKVFHKDIEIDTGTEEELLDLSMSIKEAANNIDEEVYEVKSNSKRLKSKILVPKIDILEYKTVDLSNPLKRKGDQNEEK